MKQINWPVAIIAPIVAFVAVAAFLLSFDGTRQLALASGLSYRMSYVYPLTIELAALSSKGAWVIMTYYKTNKWWIVAGMVVLVFVSVGFNVAHAWDNGIGARIVAGIPPLVMLFSVTVLVAVLDMTQGHSKKSMTLTELDRLIQVREGKLNTLNDKMEQKTASGRQEKRVTRKRKTTKSDERVVWAKSQGVTDSKQLRLMIVDNFGISDRQARRDVNIALNGAVKA